MATRPTSDRLRETLFNVLAPRMEDAAFLDLYAGSGAVGLEAASRGAAQVDFVERAAPALQALRANLELLGLRAGVAVHTVSVAAFVARTARAHDLIFLDPPWDAAAEYEKTLSLLGGAALRALAPEGLVIAEHRRKQALAERYGALARTRLLEQGDAALSFYAVQAPGA